MSNHNAIGGKPKMMSWFQTPVTVTASATGRPLNPQPRSIAKETAMPGAAPPGATYVDAVEACVTTNAWRKPRPGSAACHGGAYVRTFTIEATASASSPSQVSVLTTPQTSR